MKRTIGLTVAVIGLTGLAVLGLVLFWPRAPLDSALSFPAGPPTRLVCYGYVDSKQGQMLLQPARAGRVVHVFVKERANHLPGNAARAARRPLGQVAGG